jgi:hypothetical protein
MLSPKTRIPLPPENSCPAWQVDTVRVKAKQCFEGTVDGQALRFTRTSVSSEEGRYTSIGGCSPVIQASLGKGAAGAGSREVPVAALRAMVRFCKEVVGM